MDARKKIRVNGFEQAKGLGELRAATMRAQRKPLETEPERIQTRSDPNVRRKGGANSNTCNRMTCASLFTMKKSSEYSRGGVILKRGGRGFATCSRRMGYIALGGGGGNDCRKSK